MNKFIFLSEEFYTDYPYEKFPEIEHKLFRPYIQVCVLIGDVQYAVPLRSNINHKNVLWTDKDNKCGLDFSKAVVIEDEKYIDEKKPHIRQNEFDALRGKEYEITQRLKKFIEKYKKAKSRQHIDVFRDLVKYSTLQYFEKHFL